MRPASKRIKSRLILQSLEAGSDGQHERYVCERDRRERIVFGAVANPYV
jgi:hypothetical protein